MRPVFLVFLLFAAGALAACSGTTYPPAAGAAPSAAAPAATASAAAQPAAPATTAQPAAPAATEALAPPDSLERATAPAAGSTGQESASQGWVSSYPYGSAEGTATAAPSTGTAATAPQTAAASGVTEEGGVAPEISGWNKPDATSEQRKADIEACYRYAWSQVERDMRIDSDVASGDFNDDSGLGFTDLTKRMNLFEQRNRRTELINSCMASKGYSKG